MSVIEFFQHLFGHPASTGLAGRLVEIYAERRPSARREPAPRPRP